MNVKYWEFFQNPHWWVIFQMQGRTSSKSQKGELSESPWKLSPFIGCDHLPRGQVLALLQAGQSDYVVVWAHYASHHIAFSEPSCSLLTQHFLLSFPQGKADTAKLWGMKTTRVLKTVIRERRIRETGKLTNPWRKGEHLVLCVWIYINIKCRLMSELSLGPIVNKESKTSFQMGCPVIQNINTLNGTI